MRANLLPGDPDPLFTEIKRRAFIFAHDNRCMDLLDVIETAMLLGATVANEQHMAELRAGLEEKT